MSRIVHRQLAERRRRLRVSTRCRYVRLQHRCEPTTLDSLGLEPGRSGQHFGQVNTIHQRCILFIGALPLNRPLFHLFVSPLSIKVAVYSNPTTLQHFNSEGNR